MSRFVVCERYFLFEKLCFTRVKMAKQKTLQSIFTVIDKKKMEDCVEHEFVTLGKRLELEKAMEKEVVKYHVGRPRKELEVVLLTAKIEKLKGSTPKKAKIRGKYIN